MIWGRTSTGPALSDRPPRSARLLSGSDRSGARAAVAQRPRKADPVTAGAVKI